MSAPAGSAGATPAPQPSTRATTLAYAGVALLVIGMVLVIGGILVDPLFLPGTWVVLLGILACAAAAVVRAVHAAGTSGTSGTSGRKRGEGGTHRRSGG